MENNIGILNAIVLQNLNSIIKKKNGVKLIKEYTDLYKKNRDLLKEFMVFEYIEKIKNIDNAKDYINESVAQLDKVDRVKLNELNNKVAEFITKNKLKQVSEIENLKLYEKVNALIFTKRTINNITERIDNLNHIVSILSENKKANESTELSEYNGKTITSIILEFNEKYNDKLNDEERLLFNKISEAKTPIEKEQVFNENKKECLTLTNNFLKESIDDSTREKLLNVKEKLLEQTFAPDAYIEDVISLIELKQTLSK